jgi:hypothetical protein
MFVDSWKLDSTTKSSPPSPPPPPLAPQKLKKETQSKDLQAQVNNTLSMDLVDDGCIQLLKVRDPYWVS